MPVICPYCMEIHVDGKRECDDNEEGIAYQIPLSYIEACKKRRPIIFLMTIGYSGHGKTCYLSSLLHSLYDDLYTRSWPDFSFLGLTQDTLKSIHDTYISPLNRGDLPPRTQNFFGSPLIVSFQNIPLRIGMARRLLDSFSQDSCSVNDEELLTVFYDIGGEVYDVRNQIDVCIPLLKKINPLVFLIDLPGLIEEEQGGGMDVRENMHTLINNIQLALTETGQGKRKDIVICFTKADRMWGKNDAFGPLSEEPPNEIPSQAEMAAYLGELQAFSSRIETFVKDHYPAFYNIVRNNFRKYSFTTVSALGSNPEDGKIPVLEPNRVFDPMFWSLMMNKYL